jgi:hypothetical protein
MKCGRIWRKRCGRLFPEAGGTLQIYVMKCGRIWRRRRGRLFPEIGGATNLCDENLVGSGEGVMADCFLK